MGFIKRTAAKVRESAQFATERDPDLWDREKDDWRAAKKAKAEGRKPKPRR